MLLYLMILVYLFHLFLSPYYIKNNELNAVEPRYTVPLYIVNTDPLIPLNPDL